MSHSKKSRARATPLALPPPLQQIERTCVLYRGKKYAYFGGCDYFRLASHPAILRAIREGLSRYGLNVAASRLTTGNHPLYGELEKELAAFFEVESATLVSSGYAANLVVGQTLAGYFSQAAIDERAHASLHDAAHHLGCPLVTFKHRDAKDLARAIRRCGRSAKLAVLTDGMFAQDGQIAPLVDYLEVLPGSGILLVDDAHGAGVLGKTGRGTVEHFGISDKRVIQTITLSKAFGVYGGAVLGNRVLQEKMFAKSRLLIGNTPLPLPLAYAASEALRLLRRDRSLKRRLLQNTTCVKEALRRAGFPVAQTPSPIIPLHARKRDVSLLNRQLLAAGIYPSFIIYPGGPTDGYFRFALSSEHSRAQLDSLLKVLIAYAASRRPL